MSDLKIAKPSKSKSSNVKSTKLAPQSPANTNNGTINKPVNVPLAKKQSKTPGSILDKLDLEYLKETAIKSMRTKSGTLSVPQTREACIEYALEMVIGNLIQNGHLRPKKAQKIKSPVMIAQIGEIVDEMISAKAEISIASSASYFRRKKKLSKSKSSGSKSSRSPSRSQQKMQKWAIQPAALPITIVTTDHQSLTNLPKFTTLEKIAMSAKEHGSVKSPKNASTDNVKKQKSRSKSKNKTKSVDSSSERKDKQAPQPPLPPATTHNERQYPQPASSEVPSSNHSLENHSKTTNNVSDPTNTNIDIKVEQQTADTEQVKMEPAESTKQVFKDGNQNAVTPAPAVPAPAVTINDNSGGTSQDNRNKKEDGCVDQAQAPAHQSPPSTAAVVVDRNQIFSPLPVTPAVRTLSTLINDTTACSGNTLSSTTPPAYQTMVDMKGFQNDEISMEVEGRQLIFLASRPKRNVLNVRKVTEIVEIPIKVKMENLKIGRRTDGYVIIEEHDT